jgi:hypothetical protein
MQIHPNLEGRQNYFIDQDGKPIAIQQAVLRALIQRGEDPSTIVFHGITMPSKTAVEIGIMDEKAAEYMAQQPGPGHQFTRYDASPPPKAASEFTPAAVVDALGAFFTSRTALSKELAKQAIEDHYAATQSRQGVQ